MFKGLLALVSSGCLTYSTFDNPKPTTYGIIAASEVAVSGAAALMTTDDPQSSLYGTSYPERFAAWLGGIILTDAIVFVIAHANEH